MSIPSKVAVPVMSAVRGRRPMIDFIVTDLPEPDSPTMPSASPLATFKLTCDTA